MSLLEMFGALCAIYLFVKFFWVLGRTIKVVWNDFVIESMTPLDLLKEFANTFFYLWMLEVFNLWMDATFKDD
jgi:hypothetical protein